MRASYRWLARTACKGLGMSLVLAAFAGTAHAKGPLVSAPGRDRLRTGRYLLEDHPCERVER